MSGDSVIFNVGRPFSNRNAGNNLLPSGGLVLFGMPEFAFGSQVIAEFFTEQATRLYKQAFVNRFTRHAQTFIIRICQF